jgi:hypothetical protein
MIAKYPPPARGGNCIKSALIIMALIYGPPLAWWLWSMIDAINAVRTMGAPW